MEAFYHGLYQILEAPRLRLQKPSWLQQPSSNTVFIFLMGTYFLVTAGTIYDIIIEPPSVGQTTDAMGRSKPVSKIVKNFCNSNCIKVKNIENYRYLF